MHNHVCNSHSGELVGQHFPGMSPASLGLRLENLRRCILPSLAAAKRQPRVFARLYRQHGAVTRVESLPRLTHTLPLDFLCGCGLFA